MKENGFSYYVFNHNTAEKYYEARRGELVIRSKSLSYLKRLVKKQPAENQESKAN